MYHTEIAKLMLRRIAEKRQGQHSQFVIYNKVIMLT